MKFNMMNGGARWNKPKPVQPETRMPRAAANDGRQAPIRKDRRNLPSANNSLIDCFYRIISVNLRVNLRIGVRKGYPSAGLGIFLDKRAGFAGGGLPSVGVMAVVAAAAWRIHADGNAGGRSNAAGAWNGVGVEWGGNAGVGNLTVGFVPETDIDDVRIYSGRLPIDS
uniref:Uncharacterized protein n=1 Tax=Serratia marcescens TaxID=615 RepID=A0A1C3HG31_SERMA|nr:Uncharacterised protein [Serratia marcescens]